MYSVCNPAVSIHPNVMALRLTPPPHTPAGDPITSLSQLLRRQLGLVANPAALAALFPPPPGWQEPPAYPLLLAARPPEKVVLALGSEGPRPRSSKGAVRWGSMRD